jgi:uncharacterized protein (TIGR03437 family)
LRLPRFIAAFLVAAFCAAGQPIGPGAQREIAALLAEKAARTPAQRKMDSHLVHAAKISRGEAVHPDFPRPPGEIEAVRLDARNYVEVDITADVTPDLLDFIRALGGEVVNSFAEYRSIRARMALQTVERVAGRDEVQTIRVADPGHSNARGALQARLEALLRGPRARRPFALRLGASFFLGADTSGDVAHQANSVRNNEGYDGTGITIGVLSDGTNSLAAEQKAGRLPTVKVIQSANGDEGTALLEIVYSLAPGATLMFATSLGGQANMANNIQALTDAGCQIIIDDWTYFAEGVFQDGTVSRKVNAVSAADVFYFTNAQNSGSVLKLNSGTWEGDFADSGTSIPVIAAREAAGSAIHNFGTAANIVNADTLTRLSQPSFNDYELKWSDPLLGSSNDYDLFFLDSTLSSVLASSTNVQNGTQSPEEFIPNSTTIAVGSRIVIVKQASAAVRALHLDTERGVLTIGTTGATFGHNAASGAFSMAAADVVNAHAGSFTGGSANPSYAATSDGPRRMFFNQDGTAITPGNLTFATNGGMVLNKPDFTAADGVPTGVTGYTTFYGTSAAGPHAGAIAALVLEAVPGISVSQMRAALTASALDIEGPGWDINSGAGIVMAPAAVTAALAAAAAAQGPTINSGGVVPIYSAVNTIEPGSWVSIYGTNLAPAAATWNGDYPITLGDVSVAVNGRPAYLWYVSPGQINMEAPDDTATGPVTVVVNTPGGKAASTVTLAAVGPCFSLFGDQKHLAGVILTSGTGAYGGGSYDLVGPSGAFAFVTRPVKGGETLLLYGTGFGPSIPAVPAGQPFSGAARSVNAVEITIGGVPVTPLYSVVYAPGVYQIALVVPPNVGSGDQLLRATVSGVETPGNVFLAVQ